jgi:ABC-2 type transport system permease protein
MIDFKKFLAIAIKDVRLLIYDRNALLITVLTPLILTIVMGAAFSGFIGGRDIPIQDVPVGLVNKDKGAPFGNLGQIFDQALLRGDTTEPTGLQKLLNVRAMSETEAIQQVKAGKLAAVVIIPEDFSAQLGPNTGTSATQSKIVIYKDPAQPVGASIVSSVVQSISNNIVAGNIAVAAAGSTNPILFAQAQAIAEEVGRRSASESPITILDQNVAGQKTEQSFEPLQYFAPALAVFFLTFLMVGGASSIIEEQDNWTLQRLLISPTSATTILAGKLGGTYANGVLQLGVLIIATSLIGPVLGSNNSVWGSNLPGIILLTLSTVAAATGLGILIAALAKTARQAETYSQAILILMGIAGGTFFQISNMGPAFAILTKLTLNYWAINGFSTLSQTNDLGAVLPHIAALLGMFVVFFAIGIRQFARRLES